MMRLLLLLFILPTSILAQGSLFAADSLFKDRKFKKALVEYSELIRIRKDLRKALLGRGDCYFELKKYEKAAEDYSWVLEIEGSNTSALLKRADTYYIANEYERAIIDYSQLIERNFTDLGYVYFMRGQCKTMLENEDVEGACADIKKAQSLGYKTTGLSGLNKYCNATDME